MSLKEPTMPDPEPEAPSNGKTSNGNGATGGRDAIRRRLRALATASSFPESDEEGQASFSVDSAEGLRATFPGQDTDAGDQVVVDRAEAAFRALHEKEQREAGPSHGS